MSTKYQDWGEASEKYDEIRYNLQGRDLSTINEAQTRFDVIDRFVREILGWQHGQVVVEEPSTGTKQGYVDYILRASDHTIVIEAKKAGAAFPSPTKKSRLKLSGSVLGSGPIAAAIAQADMYASTKKADVVVVTNGVCWCFFGTQNRTADAYATLLFPLDNPEQAEELFNYFAERNVEEGSIRRITNEAPSAEDRLISAFRYSDERVGRNSIADDIMPALERALYADALLTDPDQLKRCFVTTEARAKFDTTLGIHLADHKPTGLGGARRVRTAKARGPLERIVVQPPPRYAPPVTVIIGPVGAGKSTYLKHFELVSGRAALAKHKAHWIYVDFEAMGREGSPRAFLYGQLLAYIQSESRDNTLDYEHNIRPAYETEIRAWVRGPLAPIANNVEELGRKVSERISADYDRVEPYVDKVIAHLATTHLCAIVLDNVDLYEDDELEKSVLGEGLALSRRVFCHVLVSIRDKTYVRHRTGSAFDAYELNRLWIDPPPLKSVISSRLSYSKHILKKKQAKITLPNGFILNVPDLSVFFDIVQRSILAAEAGEFVDAIADGNIRRGLTLVRNFMTSGHIEADRALKAYLSEGSANYTFPFHEIYKGTTLGQWLHFREDRADAINVFDSRLGSKRLRLLRLFILNDLARKAQSEQTVEVSVRSIVDQFAPLGASEDQIVLVLQSLARTSAVRSITADAIDADSTIVLSRGGAYYSRFLSRKFVYVEESMFDTAIEDSVVWRSLHDLTAVIETEKYRGARMRVRKDRIEVFLDYLLALESDALALIPTAAHVASVHVIRDAVLLDVSDAVERSLRYDRDNELKHL